MWLLFGALFLACPKNRLGQSGSTAVPNRAEFDALLLKTAEVERRIDQIEDVTRARGQQEIMELENLEQFRMEISNMRAELEEMSFAYRQTESSVRAQNKDSQYRLMWLEQRADALEQSLGMTSQPPALSAATNTTGQSTSSAAQRETAEQANASETSTGTSKPQVDQAQATVSSPEVNNDQPAALSTENASPEKLLELAEGHLRDGNEQLSEAVSNRFIKENPNHNRVIDAYYMLAEASFNQEKYKEALLRFQKVLERAPDSEWGSWAMLRQGECFENMNQPQNAKIFYVDVVEKYPGSKAANEATKRIKELK